MLNENSGVDQRVSREREKEGEREMGAQNGLRHSGRVKKGDRM